MSDSFRFETKIAIVLRDDLEMWQKLNVTAFLTSGLVGANTGLMGEPYQDADGRSYNALVIQPIVILAAGGETIRKIYERAMKRDARLSLYTEDMFATGHDEENRMAVAKYSSADLNVVGLALREERRIVDKITKGAKMHP